MITKGLFVKLKIRYHVADQNIQSINIALSQLIHRSFVEQQIFSVSTIQWHSQDFNEGDDTNLGGSGGMPPG